MMTTDQLRAAIRDLGREALLAEAPGSEEARSDTAKHIRDLKAFAYRISGRAHKVARHMDRAAFLLESGGSGREAAEHLWKALAAVERRANSAPPRRAA